MPKSPSASYDSFLTYHLTSVAAGVDMPVWQLTQEFTGIPPMGRGTETPYAVIADGAVRVADFEGVYCSPTVWQFFRGDEWLFGVKKRHVGEAPSVELLESIYHAYTCGLRAGESIGQTQGRAQLRSQIKTLLGLEDGDHFWTHVVPVSGAGRVGGCLSY
jgi:hypothetical protein